MRNVHRTILSATALFAMPLQALNADEPRSMNGPEAPPPDCEAYVAYDRDRAMPQFISNHGMRMVEAALRSPPLDGLELQTWDLTGGSVESLVREVREFDPDVVGFSTYLWSFPFFVEVARRLKQDDPRRLIVFGGPSARPSTLPLQASHRSCASSHARAPGRSLASRQRSAARRCRKSPSWWMMSPGSVAGPSGKRGRICAQATSGSPRWRARTARVSVISRRR